MGYGKPSEAALLKAASTGNLDHVKRMLDAGVDEEHKKFLEEMLTHLNLSIEEYNTMPRDMKT